MKVSCSSSVACGLSLVLFLAVSGCSKADKEITVAATPPPPKEAASQLQQAFTGANAEVKQTAKVASEALETANYEQAVQSLTVIKARENLTLQQGTAVYNSEMALEAKLIAGVQAGDPNAIRAYELLKKSKRR
ncbi:MAG: hypothetical protein V9H26_28900 [Verrucomicrobiota bacterium]|nr:hypothetical protein [Limisphaerales bacterium]